MPSHASNPRHSGAPELLGSPILPKKGYTRAVGTDRKSGDVVFRSLVLVRLADDPRSRYPAPSAGPAPCADGR